MAVKNKSTGGEAVPLKALTAALAAQVGDEEDDIEGELGEESRSDLLSALGELADPGGIKCQVIRVSPKETAGVCGSYGASELSIDRIREDWGAGKYQIIFRNNKGQIEAKRTISIVAKLEPKTPTGPDIATLLREMEAKQEKNTMQLMMSFMQAQMASQGELMKAIAGNRGSDFNAQSMLAMMVSIKELFKNDNAGSQVDTLVKGIELASKFGGGDSEPSTLSAILKGLELAAPLLKGAGNAPQIPPVQIPATASRALPDPRRVQPVPQSPNPTPDESAGRNGPAGVGESEIQTGGTSSGDGAADEGESMLDLLIWLREQLKMLVEKARDEKDPAIYADYVLDNLPEKVTAEVVETALTRPDWFDQVCMLNSSVSVHREWFEEFRECALEVIQEARSTQEDDSLREGTGEEIERNASEEPGSPIS